MREKNHHIFIIYLNQKKTLEYHHQLQTSAVGTEITFCAMQTFKLLV